MAAEDNRCRWGKGAPFWRPSRDRPRPRPRPSPGNNPRAIDWAAAAAAAASAPATRVRASFDASFGLLPPSSRGDSAQPCSRLACFGSSIWPPSSLGLLSRTHTRTLLHSGRGFFTHKLYIFLVGTHPPLEKRRDACLFSGK
uniref:(northern house mosquito) hypothetical protein n=1 Tax=Culex pipiens TaxID=7175 RepID=A0A8D8DXA1_CULPI